MLQTTGGGDPRESELMQLQREYRHMELNRRAYAEESNSVLRKQQVTIDKLRKDNEGIKQEIALIMRSSNRPVSQLQQDVIQSLNDQGETYANSIAFEQKNVQLLEDQIQVVKQKILQQRRAMGGVNASKENQFMIEKQIRILENRLDKSLIKFNEAITDNKILREQIDELRRERVVFENVYRKMERELQDRKMKMAEIIETSNQSYEQRDAYQMEIAAIEQANRKEQDEFEEQMITLGNLMDTELQMPVNTSASSLASRTKNISRSNTLHATKTGPPGGTMRPDETASASTQKEGKSEEDINFLERAQNFEEAFNKIKSSTGISDIDEVVKTFIKNEDHNFSLFNYVTEQNNEMEKIQEQIQQFKEEEVKYAQESGQDANQHKEVLKDLEVKLQTTDSMAEKYELRNQDLQRIIESLKRGMQTIFIKFDFASEDGTVDPTVTESNMVNYLGHIELKSNQLLQQYASLRQALIDASSKASGLDQSANAGESQMNKTLITVIGSGPKIAMGENAMHSMTVNPPKSDEFFHSDSDEDEHDNNGDNDDLRPLTRDELKIRTLNKLQKKSSTGGAPKVVAGKK